MMQLKLSCGWDDTLKKLLEAEPQLTPADIDFKEGEDDKLIEAIAYKLNCNVEQVTKWIENASSATIQTF